TMSGTASSNVFSGDPAKKFDVVFSVDMRQLMKELGATPEQIRKIIETGERNAKKAPAMPMMAMMGGPGGPGGQGGPGAASGGPAGPGGGEGGGQIQPFQMSAAPPGGAAGPAGLPGQGGPAGMAPDGQQRIMRMGGGQMSEQDREKFRQAMQKALGG